MQHRYFQQTGFYTFSCTSLYPTVLLVHDNTSVADNMARISLSHCLLATVATISAVNALALPQNDAEDIPKELTDEDFWCKTLDTSDPEAVEKLWEDGYCDSDGKCGIGSPAALLEEFTKDEANRDGWPQAMAIKYMKNAANAGVGVSVSQPAFLPSPVSRGLQC